MTQDTEIVANCAADHGVLFVILSFAGFALENLLIKEFYQE